MTGNQTHRTAVAKASGINCNTYSDPPRMPAPARGDYDLAQSGKHWACPEASKNYLALSGKRLYARTRKAAV